ncbi:peroxiredoxin [Candidatus Marinamargulisbacteria bacterium SCGC AAA071-K20]|nr:peroxiredoxin [Candidatus Marinamargulisbacteria bacterium SCGC AAA071-K20]
MLTIGEQSPSFMLKNEFGEEISILSLKGKKIVLFFYPKDDTPGCTKESIEFSEKLKQFHNKNTKVIGVSKDSVESHQKFCTKYDLKVTLLSDPSLKLIKAFGVWQEKKNYGVTYMGVIRSTFLLDEEGVIVSTWKNVKVKGHVEKVLDAVLKTD